MRLPCFKAYFLYVTSYWRTFIKYDIPGESSFTALPIKKINKKYETLGLHYLDIRLQMCVINFPLSLHSELYKN
jgi:hypothetical protein